MRNPLHFSKKLRTFDPIFTIKQNININSNHIKNYYYV